MRIAQRTPIDGLNFGCSWRTPGNGRMFITAPTAPAPSAALPNAHIRLPDDWEFPKTSAAFFVDNGFFFNSPTGRRSPVRGYEIHYKEKPFGTFDALLSHLNATKVQATADISFRTVRTNEETRTVTNEFTKLDEYRYRADVSIQVDREKSFIGFPKFLIPSFSQAEKHAVYYYYITLMVHELGHFKIAEEFANAADNINREIEGFGATEVAAKNDMTRRLTDLLPDFVKQCKLEENVNYEGITDHGVTQPDGPLRSYTLPNKNKDLRRFPGGHAVQLLKFAPELDVYWRAIIIHS